MELFRQTNIDFLKYRWWAIGASWALILVGMFAIFVQKGLKFGIDFSGGTAIAVRFKDRPDVDKVRKILDGANLGEIGIQRYEEAEKNEVLIRVQQQAKEGRDVAGDVLKALREGLEGPTDPAKIDINTQGKATLAARLAAADPDHVAGRADADLATAYGQVAEKVIAQRSRARALPLGLGLRVHPGRLGGDEGLAQREHRRRTVRAALGGERRTAGRRRPPEEGGSRRRLVDHRHAALHRLPFPLAAVRRRGGRGHRARHADHDRAARAVRPRVQPHRGRRAADARRLLQQRHRRRAGPRSREPEDPEEGAASTSSSTARSTRPCRGRS